MDEVEYGRGLRRVEMEQWSREWRGHLTVESGVESGIEIGDRRVGWGVDGVENGEWRVEHRVDGVENGEQTVESAEWHVAIGEWSIFLMSSAYCALRNAFNLLEFRDTCLHSGSCLLSCLVMFLGGLELSGVGCRAGMSRVG